METPPLARRKQDNKMGDTTKKGNTSAYAEKTIPIILRDIGREKHLRVRGENRTGTLRVESRMETPPRTRRKHRERRRLAFATRNTSAYAEKTIREPAKTVEFRNTSAYAEKTFRFVLAVFLC